MARGRARRLPARGEMTLARIIALSLVLLAMLAVPLMLWKQRDRELAQQESAERAKAGAAASAASAASAAAAGPAAGAQPAQGQTQAAPAHVNDPDRFGLSFGWAAAAAERLHASCHGEPKGLANPHRDSCNPYAGDTSCRTELPLLCARPAGAEPLALGTAPGVAGFLLASRADADARCAQALGPGWRLASFHDGGGWEVQAERAGGVPADTGRRAWVAIDDQRGNCWDPVR
jgi:hypothetical protein